MKVKKLKNNQRNAVQEELFRKDEVNIVGVGKVVINKGFDRMARILKRLRDKGYPVHWYILGVDLSRRKLNDICKKITYKNILRF